MSGSSFGLVDTPTFGAGHKGSQLHVAVRLPKLHQHFLEGVELAPISVHIVLVHLQHEWLM